ncbi:dipeptide ABC transporter ATP-binding protein [bacterium]|nr:dipeptide ABC transporter ATP-binding protein [bacterium]
MELLRVEALVKHFPIRGGIFSRVKERLKAVDGVSFSVPKGSTLGLVGESGCGKSTVARGIIRLVEPTSGHVFFKGDDLLAFDSDSMRAARRKLQIVFQDPYASLNPRMSVESIIGEPLIVNRICLSKDERRKKVAFLLEKVGLSSDLMKRYPHEFSGGQRQRIGIARALSVDPELIVADEPVSALDVSVRAQVINLFLDLQKEFGLSYLFITHDLSLIRYISDYVAVMYLGKLVEKAGVDKIFDSPLHPYTMSLISAVPIPDPDVKSGRIILKGDMPSPVNPPDGCRFHTRCSQKMPICSIEEPVMKEVKDGHQVACHLVS